MSDDWNLVYSAIEDAYMTRKMRQQAREALNRLASEYQQHKDVLEWIAENDGFLPHVYVEKARHALGWIARGDA